LVVLSFSFFTDVDRFAFDDRDRSFRRDFRGDAEGSFTSFLGDFDDFRSSGKPERFVFSGDLDRLTLSRDFNRLLLSRDFDRLLLSRDFERFLLSRDFERLLLSRDFDRLLRSGFDLLLFSRDFERFFFSGAEFDLLFLRVTLAERDLDGEPIMKCTQYLLTRSG